MAKSSHSSNDLFPISREYFYSIFNDQSIDVQLFFTVIFSLLAFLTTILIRRVVKRKLQKRSKYEHVINNFLSATLLPFMVLLYLIAADWCTSILTASTQHIIIISATKIAFVWILGSMLLLVTQRHFIAYLISIVMLVMTLLSVTGLLAPAQSTLNAIAFETDKFHITLLDIIKGLFTLVILFWGAGVCTKVCENWLRRSTLSFNARELSIKFLRIVLYILAFIFSLTEMGVNLTVLTVFGGALAVGLGFGLQKITSNFLSGIVLLFEKAIKAGDLIEIAGEKGWVRQLAIRHTLIETMDGREILIPNEELVISRVTNWTYTNTRARIDVLVTVTFDSDVGMASKLMVEAAKAHRFCISEPPASAYVKEFLERGIQLMLVFWIPDVTQGVIGIKSDVMHTIIDSFRLAGIRFAEIK